MEGSVHVGVSGFSYAGWKGTFYPEGAKPEDFLAEYASRLGSVEINSSFYAFPTAATVKSWAAKTVEEFAFSFKAPRQITHILKLGKGSYEQAEGFSRTLDLLGPRRGAVLFQLPPFMKKDRNLLEEFLSGTDEIPSRVFEFRHESWFEDSTYQLLDEYEAGFCTADTEEMRPVFEVTGGLPYFRLRKDSYDARSIDQWSEKIRSAVKGVGEGYAYLRHDETGENALLAKRLSEKLEESE